MDLAFEDVELINADDLAMARRNIINKNEVKRLVVPMLLDIKSAYTFINESIQEQLQLSVLEKRKGQLIDGSTIEYDVVGPIEVRLKNKVTVCNALVLPNKKTPYLGSIVMSSMNF